MKKKSKNLPNIKKKTINDNQILKNKVLHPLWLSVSECAKIGGITTKTIRRAMQANKVRYKIINNRYLVDFPSIITYLFSKKKLKNKLNQHGLGQYIDKWRK